MNGKNNLSLREIQNLSKDILFEFADICKEQGFTYYLAMGTLLGAARHKGFIPWDDDIDVMMPRKDYDAFHFYFTENALKYPRLKLFTNRRSDYPYMITRLSNTDYSCIFDNEDDYGLGLFIDIYPLDGVGNSDKEATKRNKMSSIYSSMCWLSTRKKCKVERTTSKLKLAIKYPAFIVSKLLGKQFFFTRLENMSEELKYDETKYIGCLVWGTASLKKYFPKEWFGIGKELIFEGRKLMVPNEYDKILKRIYGDYMILPPENQRKSHHFYSVVKK